MLNLDWLISTSCWCFAIASSSLAVVKACSWTLMTTERSLIFSWAAWRDIFNWLTSLSKWPLMAGTKSGSPPDCFVWVSRRIWSWMSSWIFVWASCRAFFVLRNSKSDCFLYSASSLRSRITVASFSLLEFSFTLFETDSSFTLIWADERAAFKWIISCWLSSLYLDRSSFATTSALSKTLFETSNSLVLLWDAWRETFKPTISSSRIFLARSSSSWNVFADPRALRASFSSAIFAFASE